ncbi:HAD hydrolase-like protein [Rhizobium sp. BK376]|uniref:HAD hydrolase-like protein n=1 Tax=Rhizobium sp. BK376 TaxID=2512149 RepID=UPI0014051E44|nr:HAD hydrolase-like protein [Rhizobium sp. BK376]
MNRHIFATLSSEALAPELCILCDSSSKDHIAFGRMMTASYRGMQKDDQEPAIAYVRRLLDGWEPDLIVCWEAPADIFRAAFPSSVVLDVMPSIFARPPYPKAISIDPVGLYQNSWLSVPTQALSAVSEKAIAMVEELRNFYLAHFNGLGCERHFRNLLALPEETPISLIPLQISKYFGFRENCEFEDQYDFLETVARAATGETVIATQYVGGLVSEKVITDANLKYLQENVGDIRYSASFEAVDSISQYIVPWVDKVYSVSSTLGLQAKLLGKTLISPSTSHLQYLADATQLSVEANNVNQDKLLAAYLSRGVVIFDRIAKEDGYFAGIVHNILERRNSGCQGADLLPDEAVVKNSYSAFISHSNLGQSVINLRKLFPSASLDFAETEIPADIAQAMKPDAVQVVSFDIFDTLVRRTVYKPEDVFELMQRQLPGTNLLPTHAVVRFAEMRQAAERLVRSKRDAALKEPENALAEEITIKEVYEEFAYCVRAGNIDVDALVRLEQEIELSVLRPRRIGRAIYDFALANKKRIVLTSDFIHPLAFIERVLEQCGYEGHERVFVSSAVGSKKHSGALFDYVRAEIAVNPDNILHIGDNPIGDVQRAREKKFRSVLIPSGRALLKEALLTLGTSEAVLDKSFYLRTIAGLFANTFLFSSGPRLKDPETRGIPPKFQMISTLEEMGFAVVGPMTLAFANWIIDRALRDHCGQIVFFARDCHLPYEMAKKMVACRGLEEQIKLVYAPTSRKSVTGFDIFSPEDVFNIRCDDFTASGSLQKLLAERFLISADLADRDLLDKWSIDSLSIPRKGTQLAAIYGLAYDIAHRHWGILEPIYQNRRATFASYLRERTTVDFSVKSAAVDFGYQGSIHKKIAPLFNEPLLPLFFMTYSNGFGEASIDGAQAFFADNRNPETRSNVCITHNLLLETLMNEGNGSALGIVAISDGRHELVTDGAVTPDHARAIRSIHAGAMLLCEEWLRECGALHKYASVERDAAAFFFSILATKPSLLEISLLSNLVFDNAFAGFQNTKIIDREAFWPEAYKIWNARNSNEAAEEQSSNEISPIATRYDELLRQAHKAWDESRYADAANYFTQAANESPDTGTHLREAAEACILNGDRNGALARLMRAQAIAPKNKAIKRRIRELNRPGWISAIIQPRPFPVAKRG